MKWKYGNKWHYIMQHIPMQRQLTFATEKLGSDAPIVVHHS